jgi:hypothetical protein
MSDISVEIFDFNQPSVYILYKKIWTKSNSPNPFISPNILYNLNKKLDIQVAFFYRNTEIFGAIPFVFKRGCFSMAGESMSDSINLLFISDTSPSQKYEAICSLIQELQPSYFEFKKFCDINSDVLLFIKAFKEFKYKYFYVESWKNLFVKCEGISFNSVRFFKTFNKSTTRNYANKFKKERNYSVRVLKDLDLKAISDWMAFFFMYHELRWAQTSTPSVFASQESRDELESKVLAWLAEGSCILFSLDVDEKPVSMAICLINNKSIIYHQIAYLATQDILRYRINKLLIFELSKWMVDNNFEILDFGVGNEPYKYEYAQLEKRIIRLYASKTYFSKLYLKGLIDYHYQRKPLLQAFVNNRLRVFISKVTTLASEIKCKLKPQIELIIYNPILFLVTVKRKLSRETQIFYLYNPDKVSEKPNDSFSVRVANSNEVIRFYSEELEFSVKKRMFYLTKMERGEVIPYAVFDEYSNVVSIAWKKLLNEFETPANKIFKDPIVIIDCYTSKSHRGKGLYPSLIGQIAAQHEGDTIIYTNDWNRPSQKGIAKAGFEPIARRLRIKLRVYDWK